MFRKDSGDVFIKKPTFLPRPIKHEPLIKMSLKAYKKTID